MDDPSTSGMDGFGLMDYNARMYDPQVGRFTSADTVVPGGVQGLDRYAYVNNSPVNYTDPSGHVIQGRCNYLKNWNCEIPAKKEVIEKVVQAAQDNPDNPDYALAAIRAIARYYGIHLPPGVTWGYVVKLQYKDYVSIDNKGGRVLRFSDSGADGWSPRGDERGIFWDGDGNLLDPTTLDNTAIITGNTFSRCGTDFSCIGAVMAHEATHSWIEYLADPTGKSNRDKAYIAPEEMVADEVAFGIGYVDVLNTSMPQHLDDQTKACNGKFGALDCSDPWTLIAKAYGINGITLDDLYSLVYSGS